jgi:hypothetical protein
MAEDPKIIQLNSKKSLYLLAVPSTQFHGDTTLREGTLTFQFFRDQALRRTGIKFNRVTATRTRAERCCTAWHIDGAYDTLAEVQCSSWQKEIYADTEANWRDKWEMHHYMIYVDSAGCFELIAESWELLAEESAE